MFPPPFGLIAGIAGAAAAFLLLGSTDLPIWARLLVAGLAVAAFPTAFGMLLTLVARRGVTRVEPPDWVAKQAKVWEQFGAAFMGLSEADLERVIPSGASAAASGIELTITAVEIRASGGYILGSARRAAHGPPIHFEHGIPLVSLSDDVGTQYAVSPSPMDERLTVPFVPAPPPAARKLIFRVDQVFSMGMAGGLIDGPWEFEVPLRQQTDD